ncbi:hypothetical protein B0H12DRAFT_1245954 [Mycena haematopus]|nr:hypothetical protein B0H12DRAFT_1245954 [Mycena haematopus]
MSSSMASGSKRSRALENFDEEDEDLTKAKASGSKRSRVIESSADEDDQAAVKGKSNGGVAQPSASTAAMSSADNDKNI